MAPLARLSPILVTLATLCGCQFRGTVPDDVVRAACASQRYLLSNGFLDVSPQSKLDIAVTESDVEAYSKNGAIDYDRLAAARMHRFSHKLLGVTTTTSFNKYIVIYRGETKRTPRCIVVTEDFRIAFRQENGCSSTASMTHLREADIRCGD